MGLAIGGAIPDARLWPREPLGAAPAAVITAPAAPAALKTGWRMTAPTPRVTIGAATAFTIALPFLSEPTALIPAERAGPTPGMNPTAFFARPPRKLKKPGSPR